MSRSAAAAFGISVCARLNVEHRSKPHMTEDDSVRCINMVQIVPPLSILPIGFDCKSVQFFSCDSSLLNPKPGLFGDWSLILFSERAVLESTVKSSYVSVFLRIQLATTIWYQYVLTISNSNELQKPEYNCSLLRRYAVRALVLWLRSEEIVTNVLHTAPIEPRFS